MHQPTFQQPPPKIRQAHGTPRIARHPNYPRALAMLRGRSGQGWSRTNAHQTPASTDGSQVGRFVFWELVVEAVTMHPFPVKLRQS